MTERNICGRKRRNQRGRRRNCARNCEEEEEIVQ